MSIHYQLLKPVLRTRINDSLRKSIHISCVDFKKQSGRHKVTRYQTKPLTYEQACKPDRIAHLKSWNSWNTSNLKDGLRPAETAAEDEFIRRFMNGTWHNMFASEIIIKRQHNIIRIGGIITRSISPSKMYFLIGYCEELLSFWLQCPIKLELQTTASKKDLIFRYI